MKKFNATIIALASSFLICPLSPAHAQESSTAAATHAAATPDATVNIVGKPEGREEHRYKDMLKAMDMFKDYQQAHPDAYLRFRIFPRATRVKMEKLKVSIVTDDQRVHVDVADDGSFTLPRIPELIDKNAEVQANWPDGELGWTVQVKRQGDPPEHRLMGDLREECHLEGKRDASNVVDKLSKAAQGRNRMPRHLDVNHLAQQSRGDTPLLTIA